MYFAQRQAIRPLARKLHQNIKTSYQIIRVFRKWKLSNRTLDEILMTAFTAKKESGGFEIEPRDPAIAGITPEPLDVASGSAAGIKNQAIFCWRAKRIEQCRRDHAHSGEPPELPFELIKI